MTTLKETLSLVHTMAPALAGHLAPVLQEGVKVQQSVQSLLHDLQEKQAAAAEHLAQLHAALQALKAVGADRHAHLEAGTAGLETAVEECLHSLEADEGELNHSRDAVSAATASLENHLREEGQRTEGAEDDSKQALASLAGSIHSGQAEVEGALHTATEQARALEHAVEETQTAITSELTGLKERMKSHLEEAQSRVTHTLEKLRELRSAHEGDIRGVAADLAGKKDHLLEEVRQRADTELKQRLETSTTRVQESLDKLARAAADARTSSERARDAVHAGFEELKEAMPPLLRAVESVKQAAGEVGLGWH